MNDLSITVTIGDRSFKVRVQREEEEYFRKAVQMIEDQMKEYSQRYAYKDKQDLLSMVLLQYVTEILRLKDQADAEQQKVILRLQQLNNSLSCVEVADQ